MERVKGIEPSSSAWEAAALPLSYTRGLSDLPRLCGAIKRPRRWRLAALGPTGAARRSPVSRREMTGFLAVALGGALGASLRYGAGLAAARWLPPGWPWATFAVNISGSFAMGLLAGWFVARASSVGGPVWLFLGTGLLGGFTTFSAFSLETITLLREGALGRAAAYAVLSVMLATGALALGFALARRLAA